LLNFEGKCDTVQVCLTTNYQLLRQELRYDTRKATDDSEYDTYHIFIIFQSDLRLVLLDLFVVCSSWNMQVIHRQRPKRGEKLQAVSTPHKMTTDIRGNQVLLKIVRPHAAGYMKQHKQRIQLFRTRL